MSPQEDGLSGGEGADLDSSSQSRSLLQDSSMDFESPDVLRRIQMSGLGRW